MMLKWLIILVIASVRGSNAAVCSESLTTVSGSFAPQGPICGNRLLFSEEFNDGFDTDLWMHELTMNGGGVGL